MDTFEELGLGPELVDALLAEGAETPTALQREVIPVIRRGNPAVIRAGSGAGVVVAWAAPLLDRLEPGAGQPVALALVPTREVAEALAFSLGRMGLATGHRMATLGGAWALPGHADLLVTTPDDLDRAARAADVKLDRVEALVLHGAGVILEPASAPGLKRVLEHLGESELQTVLVADPLTAGVRAFVDEHVPRAVFLPSEAAGGKEPEAPVERGILKVLVLDGGAPHRPVAAIVAGLLDDDARHVLLYFRTEDRAADAADLLTVQGYASGWPGDAGAPVWLGLDPLEARRQMDEADVDPERVAVVSVDLPSDADILDRRHGGGHGPAMVLVEPRELVHLRRVAREAGYRLEVLPSDGSVATDEAARFRARVQDAMEETDLGAYLSLLEPLLERWSGAEVAAALAALLRRQPVAEATAPAKGKAPAAPLPGGAHPPAWTRLFLSVGSRDGVGPGDILGAITGEAGLQGDQVGRIDIRDTFTRVEVEADHAARVIQALNGTSLRGRSVRADFDRGGERGGERGGGRGGERGGGRRPDRGGPPRGTPPRRGPSDRGAPGRGD